MRKFCTLLLLLALLLSLGACASSQPAPAASQEASGTGEELASSNSSSGTDTDTDSTTADPLPPDTIVHTLPQRPTQDTSDVKSLEKGKYLVGLTDQLNKRIIVCDLAVEDWSGDKAVVWKCNTYGGVAGIKFRDSEYWGEEVVLICSGYQASIISYKTKKTLLHVTNGPHNSHSVELLPNGAFVVAGSTGNEVKIYGAGKTEPSDSVTLSSAHGALWDPKYNVLWLAGDNILAAYRVKGTAENPKLEAVKEMNYCPNTAIHDLTPVYGDPDSLLVTGARGVVMVDKKTGKTSMSYSGGGFLKTQTYVPGVGIYEDGVCVFTTIRSDTLTYKEWGTDQVGVFIPSHGAVGKVYYRQDTSDAYYKCRIWCTDYQ